MNVIEFLNQKFSEAICLKNLETHHIIYEKSLKPNTKVDIQVK